MNWEDLKVQQQIRHIFSDNIRLCGCGRGGEWDVIKALLERSEDPEHSFYEAMPEHDLSARSVEVLAKFLDAQGILDHGTGIGWAFLSEEGEALLAFLRKFGTDDDKWPEWYATVPYGVEW